MTFGDCTRDLVLSFLEWMRDGGLSAGTCNNRLAALRSYLWYAAGDDVAIQSVALAVSRVPKVKGPQRVKEVLSEAALRAVLSAPDADSPKGVRDRAMLALLYDSAIRLSELVGLTVGDVRLDGEPSVFVTGKGRKERFVAITEPAAAQLRAHIARNHGDAPDSSEPLFYTVHQGKHCRMSDGNVQRIVQQYANKARESCPEVPEKVYPHMMRRTRATDLWEAGVEAELISNVLGHASVNTTMLYAKPSLEKMRAAMESGTSVPDAEEPAWVGSEDEMARLCGLR